AYLTIFEPTRIPYLIKEGITYALLNMMLDYLFYSVFFILPFGMILGVLFSWDLIKSKYIIIKSVAIPLILSIPYIFIWLYIIKFFFAGYGGFVYIGFLNMIPFLFGMLILLGILINVILHRQEKSP
ncbi:MAG: hypothetical protein ABIG89_00365, partial [Candidatus Woesearchaeota archaeon]